ncbi:hypothetical protein ACC806_38885, partial [Rhizobium ruizarguesonis]
VMLFQVTVRRYGRGWNRYEVAYYILRGIGRSWGKPCNFGIDHISVFIRLPKNDVGVAVGRYLLCWRSWHRHARQKT